MNYALNPVALFFFFFENEDSSLNLKEVLLRLKMSLMTEAGVRVHDQPGLHRETLSQTKEHKRLETSALCEFGEHL